MHEVNNYNGSTSLTIITIVTQYYNKDGVYNYTVHTFLYRKHLERNSDKIEVTEGFYEDPDKLTSRGQGNYELTHCPAYESTIIKPQPRPTGVDQSIRYEI